MTQPFGCQSVDGIVLALVANGWTKAVNFQAPSNLMAGEPIHLPKVESRPFFYLNLGDPELFDRLILHPQYGEQSDDVGIELLATMKPTPEAVGLLLHQWEQSWGKAA